MVHGDYASSPLFNLDSFRALKTKKNVANIFSVFLQHQRLRKQIEEVLDMDVIRQQVDAGTIEPYG